LDVQTKGEFGGLGISVTMRNGALTVIAPLDGTPADKAGVKAGDIILKIDDKATIGMNIDDAVKLMRGKPKTDIILTIVRKGETKPLKIKIARDIIKIDSVYAKNIEKEKDEWLTVMLKDLSLTEKNELLEKIRRIQKSCVSQSNTI